MPPALKGDVRTNGSHVTSGSGQWSKYERKRAHTSITWGEVDAAAIGECVAAVTAAGDAILFGTTSDAGSLVITVCSGQRRIKFYATTAKEAAEHLAAIENAAADEKPG
jgi:phage tail sheath gpL-like